MKTIRNIGILLFLLTLAACSTTAVRQHEDYVEIAQDISSVVIVPPAVDIELITFDGDNEELIDDQNQIREELTAIAKQRLDEEGLRIIEFDFTKAMTEDEDFAYAVTQCQEAWDLAKLELYEKGLISESKKSTFRATLGPVTNHIAERTGADSILLIHYEGYKKSQGVIAKDMGASILVGILTAGTFVPVQAMSSASLETALVETHSGQVIWSNQKMLGQVDSSLADMVFKELPDVEWESEGLARNMELEQPVLADSLPSNAEDTSSEVQ